MSEPLEYQPDLPKPWWRSKTVVWSAVGLAIWAGFFGLLLSGIDIGREMKLAGVAAGLTAEALSILARITSAGTLIDPSLIAPGVRSAAIGKALTKIADRRKNPAQRAKQNWGEWP